MAVEANLVLVFEIRVVRISRGDAIVDPAEKGFWTILPVFRDNGYVDSGSFLLPLYKGAVPAEIKHAYNDDPYSFILNELKKPKKLRQVTQVEGGASLLVRLADAQCTHFVRFTPPKRVDYVAKVCKVCKLDDQDYSFNYEANVPPSKQVRKLLPKNRDPEEWLTGLNKLFARNTKISHYILD